MLCIVGIISVLSIILMVLGAVHIWHYNGYPIGDDSDSDVEGTELETKI